MNKLNFAEILTWCAPKLKTKILLPAEIYKLQSDSIRQFFPIIEKNTDLVLANIKQKFELIVRQHMTEQELNSAEVFNLKHELSNLTEDGVLLFISNLKLNSLESLISSEGFVFTSLYLNSDLYDEIKCFYFCFKHQEERSKSQLYQNHSFLQAVSYKYYAEDYTDDIEFMKKWVRSSKSILEIGIGTGRLAQHLIKYPSAYYGIDLSAGMLFQIYKKKLDKNKIFIDQQNMLNFSINKKFDSIIYPFRVLPYCENEDQIKQTLLCSIQHLNDNGRILINMLDFTDEFVNKWHNKVYTFAFTGPTGEQWIKTDKMYFENNYLKREIQFTIENTIVCSSVDNLFWINSSKLTDICNSINLTIANIWPAYQFKKYSEEGEYLMELKKTN
jgi:SAM-dependent methyltransferase